jgi:hypothetical protein
MRIRLLLVCVALSALCPALHATSVVPPQFAELVNGSDYIIRARVKRVSYTATERPGKPPLIYTHVALEVIETIAGEPPVEPVLRCLGGRFGEYELRVGGAPQFKEGDEDVLFVAGNGRDFFPLYAIMHGRYRVRHDAEGREFIARSNDVPLSDVAEIAAPMSEGSAAALQRRFKSKSDALTPQSFAAKIREARHAK